jgi:hypothetical protein
MKRNISLFTVVVLILFVFSGCKDLLEEKIYTELDPSGLLGESSGAEAVLYAAYAEANMTGWDGKGVINLEEWCTDIEWETGGGENRTAVLMIGFTWDSQTEWIRNLLWNRPYRAIRNANVILDNIDASSLNEDEKKLVKAEARFIRAMTYYNLYTWFGPVPLRKSQFDDLELAKATEEEMLGFIETELAEIIPDLPLPGSESHYGRANKGAAHAYLCKFYLNTKQWEKCIAAANSVVGFGYYELYPVYTNLFKVENERNKEFIWVHQGVVDDLGCNYINGAFPIGFSRDPKTGFTWTSNMANWAAQYRLYDSFFNSFENGDLRKELIISEYINQSGNLVSLLGANNTRSFKYWPDVNAQANDHGNDIPDIRYADILLSKAEALNELNGPTQEVLDLINDVRNRADLDELLLSGFPSKESLRDHILAERGWEFYTERKRRQDLIRHGKFVSSAIARGAANAKSYHVRFPIPQTELDANPQLIQNEGYGN